jgi:hypothetical protein
LERGETVGILASFCDLRAVEAVKSGSTGRRAEGNVRDAVVEALHTKPTRVSLTTTKGGTEQLRLYLHSFRSFADL